MTICRRILRKAFIALGVLALLPALPVADGSLAGRKIAASAMAEQMLPSPAGHRS